MIGRWNFLPGLPLVNPFADSWCSQHLERLLFQKIGPVGDPHPDRYMYIINYNYVCVYIYMCFVVPIIPDPDFGIRTTRMVKSWIKSCDSLHTVTKYRIHSGGLTLRTGLVGALVLILFPCSTNPVRSVRKPAFFHAIWGFP